MEAFIPCRWSNIEANHSSIWCPLELKWPDKKLFRGAQDWCSDSELVAISELKPIFFSIFGPYLKWIFQLTQANFEANSAKILVQTPKFRQIQAYFLTNLTQLSHKYLPIESRPDLCLLRLSNGIEEDCGVQSFIYFMTVLDGAEHLSFSHHTVQTKTPPWAKCQAAFLLREPPPPSGVLRMCRVKMCLDPEASLHCLSLHIS